MNVKTDNGRSIQDSLCILVLCFPSLREHLSTKRYSLVVLIGLILATCSKPVLSEILNCKDTSYLIEHSANNFVAIREDKKSEYGGYLSKFELSGAEYCAIIEDVEKVSYRCTWKYSYGDEQARDAFRQLASDVQSCLGDKVTVREDQAVNHPDSYESYLLELPDGEARITLKNKIELNSTFVSFFIGGVR